MMNKIRKGDTVQVLAGNDRGKKGEVHTVLPKENKVIVSGINLVKKHQRRTGDVRTQAGIIEREGPIDISKVAIVCKNCGKASRVQFKTFEDGTKARVCQNCNQAIE
ncbi:MAG: 50S ribosomal protein L24 [Chloroflexota bacterium]|nr:50S ribosomal protein L24 [Chloroflexota bacterium]